MLNSSISPPRLVYESCAESTAPVEVSVVDAANTEELGTPKRCSTPSMAAPTAVGTVPWCCNCIHIVIVQLNAARTPITAAIA